MTLLPTTAQWYEKLERLGYKQSNVQEMVYPGANAFYQKVVKDRHGRRYFVNLTEYFYNGESCITANMQVNDRKNYCHNYDMFTLTNINDVLAFEKQAHKFWKMCGSVYYEKWDK